MDFNSNKFCKIIPKDNILDHKKNKLKEVIKFYKNIFKSEALLTINKDIYLDLVSQGERFKLEIEINLSDEEFRDFSNCLNNLKDMKLFA
tara:strand:- start:109 stop:378 length:270 start_codon:yes stop_codon:yes gene_type:complete